LDRPWLIVHGAGTVFMQGRGLQISARDNGVYGLTLHTRWHVLSFAHAAELLAVCARLSSRGSAAHIHGGWGSDLDFADVVS
jgi:hypothetical protein